MSDQPVSSPTLPTATETPVVVPAVFTPTPIPASPVAPVAAAYDAKLAPIPLKAFAATLVKTEDEVWTKLLQILHGAEKHTLAAWRALLDALRNQPAH